MMGLGKRVAALERRMTLQAKTIKLLCDALEKSRKEAILKGSIPTFWPEYLITLNGEKKL